MMLLLKVACLSDNSKMRKAVMDEALARHMRYLPLEEKYKIIRLLEKVKKEDPRVLISLVINRIVCNMYSCLIIQVLFEMNGPSRQIKLDQE